MVASRLWSRLMMGESGSLGVVDIDTDTDIAAEVGGTDIVDLVTDKLEKMSTGLPSELGELEFQHLNMGRIVKAGRGNFGYRVV